MEHPYEDRYKRVYAAGARFWETPLPTEELMNFLDEWKPRIGKVIEFGCGEGRDSIFLAHSGYDVTGVDIAPSAINRAREWAREEGLEIDFHVGDVTALSGIPDNHLDPDPPWPQLSDHCRSWFSGGGVRAGVFGFRLHDCRYSTKEDTPPWNVLAGYRSVSVRSGGLGGIHPL